MTDYCFRHPDREASYYCQKERRHMCEECACCVSPGLYCRYRTSCVLAMLTKEGELSPCSQTWNLVASAESPQQSDKK
jgi:hypothetical protein